MNRDRPASMSVWGTHRKRWVIACLALALVAVAIGVTTALTNSDAGGPDEGLKTFIVAGTVRLSGQPGLREGRVCSGAGADGDLREGAVVVVYGDHDEILGTGHLNGGVGTSEGGAI